MIVDEAKGLLLFMISVRVLNSSGFFELGATS